MPHKHVAFYHRPSRIYSEPGPTSIKKQIAIVFKMGTLEETKDKAWTWVLSAPVDVVKAAGVDFDPDARSIKSVQGDAGGANSALEVKNLSLVVQMVILDFMSHNLVPGTIFLVIRTKHPKKWPFVSAAAFLTLSR